MTTQLVLIDEEPATWRLDERTREVGRRGVARARQALGRPRSEPTEPAPSRAA